MARVGCAIGAPRVLRAALLGAAAALGGCVAATVPVAPCCYQGEVVGARLSELAFATEDGAEIAFATVFPDFRPTETLFTRALPFREADIGLVPYSRLRAVLEAYDANADTVIEEPELAVLYLGEAARGLGHPVRGLLHAGRPVHALALARADLGALVSRVERARLGPDASALFGEIALLGIDLRTRARDGAAERERVLFQVD